MTTPRLTALCLALITLAGCKIQKSGDDRLNRTSEQPSATAEPAVHPQDTASAPAAPAELAVNTPAGGLEDWIGEVEKGLADLPSLAVKDVGAAQKKAMDLYLSRQEYIEMYWGSGARLKPSPVLIQAVTDAESRFTRCCSWRRRRQSPRRRRWKLR